MPVVCIAAPLESTNQLQLSLATANTPGVLGQPGALAPLMLNPMVLQPQQVVLGMPQGALLTTSMPTMPTTGQPHCSSSNMTDNQRGAGGGGP